MFTPPILRGTHNVPFNENSFKRSHNKHALEVCLTIVNNALAFAKAKFPLWDRATLQFNTGYDVADPDPKILFNTLVSQFALCVISNYSVGDVKIYSDGGSFGVLRGNIDNLTPELLEERMHLVAAQIFGRSGYRSLDFIPRLKARGSSFFEDAVYDLNDIAEVESDPQKLLFNIERQLVGPAERKRWMYSTKQVIEGMLSRNRNSTNPAGDLHELDTKLLKGTIVKELKPLAGVRQDVINFYQWLLQSLRQDEGDREFLTEVISKCESLAKADPYGYVGESKLVFEVLIYSLKLRLQSTEIDPETKGAVIKLEESGDYERFLKDAVSHLKGSCDEAQRVNLLTDCLIFIDNHFAHDEVQPIDELIDMLCKMLLLIDTPQAVSVIERLSYFPTAEAKLNAAFYDQVFTSSDQFLMAGLMVIDVLSRKGQKIDDSIREQLMRVRSSKSKAFVNVARRILSRSVESNTPIYWDPLVDIDDFFRRT